MRIALIAPLAESVPPKLYGGTERVIYNLCHGLTEAGMQPVLFASQDSSTRYAELVPVVPEAFRLSPRPIEDPAAYHIAMLSMLASRANEFDIIHNHHDYWMLPLHRMMSTPMVTTLHNSLERADVPVAFGAFPEAPMISISDSQRAPMPGLNWMRTIYHGMDLQNFRFQPRQGKYLAFLGRVDEHKRPEWAVRIAQLSGVPLKIAAKIDGARGRQYYDTFIKPHVDGKFIEYVGEVSEAEKSEFLGGALGLVFPIDWAEPFGLVVTEALACGTPVLTRPCGSVAEITADGITGYCHADIRRLASRVPDLLRIDRAGCRRWVEEKFSLRRMTEDYIDVYRQLIRAGESAGLSKARGAGRAFARQRLAHRHRRDLVHPFERLADGDSQA